MFKGTATVLARAIFTESCKVVAARINSIDLKRSINIAVENVVAFLTKNSKKIQINVEIKQVFL